MEGWRRKGSEGMKQYRSPNLRVWVATVSQERPALAATLIVAITLVGLFRAPVWPVVGGSMAALSFLLARSYFRRGSKP
jgi:hypothetical protein